MSQFIQIQISCASSSEAEQIANELVKAKLAACCQIVPEISSIYYWQGKLVQEKETLLKLKTAQIYFDKIADLVNQLHSYEVVEIIALPLVQIDSQYSQWLKETLKLPA